VLLGIRLYLVWQNGIIVLAVVLTKFDRFVHLSFSISNRLPHFGCDSFSNFLESLLNALTQIFDQLRPFLDSSVPMNLKGSSGPLKFLMKLLIADKLDNLIHLSRIRVPGYNSSHVE